jgi:hypothetical protein
MGLLVGPVGKWPEGRGDGTRHVRTAAAECEDVGSKMPIVDRIHQSGLHFYVPDLDFLHTKLRGQSLSECCRR